jgi:hypothetical protein
MFQKLSINNLFINQVLLMHKKQKYYHLTLFNAKRHLQVVLRPQQQNSYCITLHFYTISILRNCKLTRSNPLYV